MLASSHLPNMGLGCYTYNASIHSLTKESCLYHKPMTIIQHILANHVIHGK
jgi:hypothetical protein